MADVLDVVRADHFCDGDGARVRRVGLAQEVRDELVHAGVREQQARLRRRDQRRRADARVPALLEERQERLTDAVAFHAGSLPVGQAGGAGVAGTSCGAELGLARRPSPACPPGSTRRPASRSPSAALRLAGQRRGGDALRLLLGPSARDDRRRSHRRPGRTRPRTPRFTSCGPRRLRDALAEPGAQADDLDQRARPRPARPGRRASRPGRRCRSR